MSTRKVFIVDTSVLLYDKTSIHSFPGNDVILPLIVLDEIDRFKDKQGLLGESARYVIRFLDSLREQGGLQDGVTIDGDQTVTVVSSYEEKIPAGLDKEYGDNKILGTAIFIKAKFPDRKVIVVTKDINLRVKSDALGIEAQDYYKDRVIDDRSKIYTGCRTLDLTDSEYDVSEFIDDFYVNGFSPNISSIDLSLYPNEFVILKSGQKSLMGININNVLHPISEGDKDGIVTIKPRNKEQKFAMHLLTDPRIPLVTINGIAGSGKTYITLLWAMSCITIKSSYKRIVFTRSIQPVGKEIGFLPGDLSEKMTPWLSPVMDNFRTAFDDRTMFDMLVGKGQIEIAPLTFMRGRTFDDSIIIVDEAQNATIHEIKTIITRVGKNSKVVLLGDTDQIDTPYIDSLSNGLTVITEKFKEEKLAGHITLVKGERSELATLASRII